MNRLFCAESVVVVGVSESKDNLGKNVMANLVNLGYQGKIYAVGPRGGEVLGHPVYRSISDLPGNPELAVILTPARSFTICSLNVARKVHAGLLSSPPAFENSGTREKCSNEEILKASKRFGLRFVGPNCVGTGNTANGLYTAFVTFVSSSQER